jgi:hypothetical protein
MGLWTGDAVDLTVIVAELGQLLLNSGNRRHRRSGYRVSRPVTGVVGRILLVIVVIVTEWVTPPIRASVPISAAVVRATIPMASVPVMAVASGETSRFDGVFKTRTPTLPPWYGDGSGNWSGQYQTLRRERIR